MFKVFLIFHIIQYLQFYKMYILAHDGRVGEKMLQSVLILVLEIRNYAVLYSKKNCLLWTIFGFSNGTF